MQATQEQKQRIAAADRLVVVGAIIALTAEVFAAVFTVTGNVGHRVFFIAGIMALVVALACVASATVETIFIEGRVDRATKAWFIAGIWFINGLLQLGFATFGH